MRNLSELALREERLRMRLKHALGENVGRNVDLLDVFVSMWADAYAEWFAELKPDEQKEVLRRNLLLRGKSLDMVKVEAQRA